MQLTRTLSASDSINDRACTLTDSTSSILSGCSVQLCKLLTLDITKQQRQHVPLQFVARLTNRLRIFGNACTTKFKLLWPTKMTKLEGDRPHCAAEEHVGR